MNEKSLLRLSLGLNILVLVVLFCFAFPSCSTGNGSTIPNNSIGVPPVALDQSLKVSASNVVFRKGVKRDDVSEVKVYADNVILDNTGTSLQATNVQAAFQETQPVLSEILPGTWSVITYYNGEIFNGTVTFNSDETFSCDDNGGKFIVGEWQYTDHSGFYYSPISYKLMNSDAIYLTYHVGNGYGWAETDMSMTISFAEVHSNKLRRTSDNFTSSLIKN